MSKKIIGVTVGTQLPKPNFKQNDPTKGDYIKNKPDFEGLKSQVNTISDLVGDKTVADQISAATESTFNEFATHIENGYNPHNITWEHLGGNDWGGDTVSWNIDIDGREFLEADGITYYKVSDKAPSSPMSVIYGQDACVLTYDGPYVLSIGGGGSSTGEIPEGNVVLERDEISDEVLSWHDVDGLVYVITELGMTSHDNTAGTYFSVNALSLNIPGCGMYSTLKKINVEYLPDYLQFDEIVAIGTDAKAYIDAQIGTMVGEQINNAVSQKSQVQIITWGDDD